MPSNVQFVNYKFKVLMQDGSTCFWEFTQHEFISNKIYWSLVHKNGDIIDSILIDKTRALKIIKRTKKMLEYKMKRVK